MYQSILVGLDGSAFSASALPAAAALARRTGGKLHLVVVFDPSSQINFGPGEATIPVFDASMVDARCAELTAWVKELASSIANTGVPAEGVMLEGTVVEALAEHAVTTGAELAIMTTHGRGGLDRLRLGSVVSSFLARSPIPVFLVRPTGPDAPTGGRELPSGTLLVTLDGSPFSESMLPHAARFASALGMTMDLVHVVEPAAHPLALFGADALIVEDFVSTDEEENARLYLTRAAGTVTLPSPPKLTVLSDNSPARAIIEYTQQTHPGVIAVATHGRSGLARMLLGSVADKVLHGVAQPMLVFRPPDSPST